MCTFQRESVKDVPACIQWIPPPCLPIWWTAAPDLWWTWYMGEVCLQLGLIVLLTCSSAIFHASVWKICQNCFNAIGVKLQTWTKVFINSQRELNFWWLLLMFAWTRDVIRLWFSLRSFNNSKLQLLADIDWCPGHTPHHGQCVRVPARLRPAV